MQRISILICLCTCVLSLSATNKFSLSASSGHPGDTLTVSVSLENSDAVTALQATIPLDANLKYVTNSVVLNNSRSNGHSLMASAADDTLRVAIFSFSQAVLNGSDGELLTFKVVLGIEPATYTLTAEPILTGTSGQALECGVTAGSLTILSPKIQVVTTSLNYGHVPIRSSYNRTLQVRNVGNEPLHVSNVLFSAAEFSVASTEYTIAANQTQNIVITYAPVLHGAISESVRLRSDAINDPDVYGANICSLIADPYSVNELRMQAASGISDDTVTVRVRMNNMENIVGVQFSIKMPSALEYIANSAAPLERASGHSVLSTMSNDTLTLLLYHPSNTAVTDDDGDLFSFRVRLNGSSGSYTLRPINTLLVNAAHDNMLSAVYNANVTIQSPTISANNSINYGHITVAEPHTVSYAIRNTGQTPLTVERATFLSEGLRVITPLPIEIAKNTTQEIEIELTPFQEGFFATTMQIYSNDPASRMKAVSLSADIYEPNSISLSGELTEDGYLLHVTLDNYTDIVGFQMDMSCMPDMHPELQKSTRLNNHQTLFYSHTDSTFKILAYSLTNTPITAHSGELFSILFRNTNVPSYNHSCIVLDNIILSDDNNQQRLTSNDHMHLINEQRSIVVSAENGIVVISDSTPASTVRPPVKPVYLPDVPFEFDFKATDFDASTATIANHPNANLSDYQLKLTSNIPVLSDSCLTITSICKGYINKWNFEATASGTYFKRSGNNNMTIICKVAPQLGTNNASDFISNRGSGYNYMFRVGDYDSWFLHTGTAYSANRALTFADNSPQTLVCRVNGAENYILLENKSTGASKQMSGVNWGGTNTIFKFFYNSNGEYFRGDFYWVYYSFNYLSDDEVQQVIDYHNGSSSTPTDPSSSEPGMYDYSSILYLSAIPNEGYAFEQWSDGDSSNPRIVTVTADAEYTAIFKADVITNIETIENREPITKLLIDEKIYILRGDKVYTVTGQLVK